MCLDPEVKVGAERPPSLFQSARSATGTARDWATTTPTRTSPRRAEAARGAPRPPKRPPHNRRSDTSVRRRTSTTSRLPDGPALMLTLMLLAVAILLFMFFFFFLGQRGPGGTGVPNNYCTKCQGSLKKTGKSGSPFSTCQCKGELWADTSRRVDE